MGRTRAQQTEEFDPEAKQGVSYGQRSSTLLSQHFKWTSCVSYVSRGEISKPSTRHSLGTTTLSVKADASGVDDYSVHWAPEETASCNHNLGGQSS